MIISDEDVIDEPLISIKLRVKKSEIGPIETEGIPELTNKIPLKHLINEYERKVLSHYLSTYKPMKRCADVLGIDLTTLARKKKRYNL